MKFNLKKNNNRKRKKEKEERETIWLQGEREFGGQRGGEIVGMRKCLCAQKREYDEEKGLESFLEKGG
jgi:hypothetical protein